MVIKITKKDRLRKSVEYKSSKLILTPKDIEEADKFDVELSKVVNHIENILLDSNILDSKLKKKDPLKVWYIIGEHLNKFLEKHRLAKEDEPLFWNYLYGKSSILHKGIPSSKISRTRNDFRTASILARYPFDMLEKVGPWAMWREILTYRVFLSDRRILEWLIRKLIKKPRTRDNARPFLKSIAARLKKIDTSVLNNDELLEKLKTFDK